MNLNHLIKAYKISLTDEKDKQRLHETISNAFLSENRNLLNNKMIDSTLSGTTCVSLIYTPEKMTIANIGDSRCILGEELSNGQWKTHELSRDHKPTIPEEAERIRKVGGRIRPMKDDDGTFIGPLRVYMKDKDMPGLAMTRSFGDYYASTAGTISEPEISEYYFNEGDRFLILASDGLFEFINRGQLEKKFGGKAEDVESGKYFPPTFVYDKYYSENEEKNDKDYLKRCEVDTFEDDDDIYYEGYSDSEDNNDVLDKATNP